MTLESSQVLFRFSEKQTFGLSGGFLPPWVPGSFQFRAPLRNVGFCLCWEGLPSLFESSQPAMGALMRAGEGPGKAFFVEVPTAQGLRQTRAPGTTLIADPQRLRLASDNAQCALAGPQALH